MTKFVTLQFIDIDLDPKEGYPPSDFGGCEVRGAKMSSGYQSPELAESEFGENTALDDDLCSDLWSETTHELPFSDLGTEIRVVQVIVWFGGQIAPPSKQLKNAFWVFLRGGRAVLGRMATREAAIVFAGQQVGMLSKTQEGPDQAQSEESEASSGRKRNEAGVDYGARRPGPRKSKL